eukprot:g31300.t1
MKRALPVVANLVSSMKVTSPEVLRATPAYRPFQRCGQAFDPGLEKELSKRSYKVERITTFWSHSWHGPRWPKALTLMVIYNGRIAVCLGTLAAFLMMILFSFQLLPGFSRLTWDDEHLFSYWCTMTGSIVSFLTFIFWRPHQLVFFDRMCIPENDSQLKAEAIYSLAGILNNSSSMLVLWDASWSERLWCLFELAAFLKSQKDRSRSRHGRGQCLEIRPSILGPSLLFVFLTVSVASAALAITPVSSSSTLSLWIPITSALLTASAVGAMAMSALRSYFRSVEALEEKLKLVALDGTHCTCCEKHRPPWPTDAIGIGRVGAGQLVKECLKIWFGSEEDFENYVRSEVWQAMSSESWKILLRRLVWLAHIYFVNLWAGLFAEDVPRFCTPLLWAFMDLAASYFTRPYPLKWIAWGNLVDGLVILLILCPFAFHSFLFLARRFRQRGATFAGEVLRNLFVVLCAVLSVACYAGFYVSSWVLFNRSAFPAMWRSGWVCLAAAMLLLRC